MNYLKLRKVLESFKADSGINFNFKRKEKYYES